MISRLYKWANAERRLAALALISLGVGLAAATAVIWAASAQGIDPARLTGDAKGYVLLAQNIYEHGVFSFSAGPPFAPDSFRAPGYPFFLAALYAIFQSWLAVLIVQAILVSAAPVLLYVAVRPLHERAAWWGALLFAFEPIRLFASSTLLSDALFVCLLLGVLALFMQAAVRRSPGLIAFAGLILGAAILVRPVAQFLPVVFLAYLALVQVPWRRAVYLAAIFLLACGATVTPWMMRNHALFGSWNISSVGAYNLAVYNAPEYARYRPTAERTRVLEEFEQHQESLPREDRTSLSRSSEFSAVFKDVVRGSKFDYALFHIFKTVPFFLTDGLRDTARLFGIELGMPNITSAILSGQAGELVALLRQDLLSLALLVAGSGTWAAVLCLCAWFIYQCLRGRADRRWFFLAALALYFAVLTGPVSNARYRLPAEGFLLTAASAALIIKKREA